MSSDTPVISFTNFDDERYLSANPDVAARVLQSGVSPLEDYLAHGLDEGYDQSASRAPLSVRGSVDRVVVSNSGYFLIVGWIDDEGMGQSRFKIQGADFQMQLPPHSVFRFQRQDVEGALGRERYDFGFIIYGKSPSRLLLKQQWMISILTDGALFQVQAAPEVVSNKRAMDNLLTMLAGVPSHTGREVRLSRFMKGWSGACLVETFQDHVAGCMRGYSVERFGARAVSMTFVTVLFGSTEPMLLQPLLFRDAGIPLGEWIFVCNSPEDAAAAVRIGRMVSSLYDIMITVVAMPENAGFGAANNVAIAEAASDDIYIINPDVFPVLGHAASFNAFIQKGVGPRQMAGGLLFYDEQNLMHSGMYTETDRYFPNRSNMQDELSFDPVSLLRVEHYDKGVPFEEGLWSKPREVTAITGAVMVFKRQAFEAIGGFSTQYIYGHYEDADLSIRWADAHEPVIIDPLLRLVHLEGQGSRSHGEQYRGAATVNRYIFSARHSRLLAPAAPLADLAAAGFRIPGSVPAAPAAGLSLPPRAPSRLHRSHHRSTSK